MKSSKKHLISTFDRQDYYHNWEKINENLAQRWDNVIQHNPHHNIGHTITDKYWTGAIIDLLDNWMPKKKGLRILKYDLYNEATGTAEVTDWFLKRGYEFYGVDISIEVIKRAKKNFGKKVPQKNLVLGDIRCLPFKNNFFDIVFSLGTIEHIRENQMAVNEAYRVLKPGGVFISGVNNRLDMWGSYFIYEITNKIFKHMTSYEPTFFPWNQRAWFLKAGFVKVRVDGMLMIPHLVRYLDLFIAWKVKNKILKNIWEKILKIVIAGSKLLDSLYFFRYFAIQTVSLGYKKKK
jgi:ubiquinone/menaquinone biosynthesis C-methylase UbiE